MREKEGIIIVSLILVFYRLLAFRSFPGFQGEDINYIKHVCC
jgi:hypothetical protein